MSGNGNPPYDDGASRLRQPDPNEQQEKTIVGKLQTILLSTPWSKDLFENQLRPFLVAYFKDSLSHLEDREYIHRKTQEALKQFAQLSHSEIIEGQEHLDLLKGQSVFLLTNHLGTYKLLGVDPSTELGHPEINLPVLHPFPAFFGSLFPVAEALGDKLYESAHDYPGPIRTIQLAAGSLILPPGRDNTLLEIERETEELFAGQSGSALTIFPEGGTSGKRNNGGPYSLDKFRTGSLVIAADLGIPVVPVAQYFNPEEGFKLKVFSPLHLQSRPDSPESRDYFHSQAAQTQTEMQTWLNQQSGIAA